MRRALRLLTLACAALLAGGALWCSGFAVFDGFARQASADPGEAEGIVVLTGGAERLDTGLRLLLEGRAPVLLVSGAGRGLDLAELSRRVPLSPEQAAHVTFGRMATSTLGNATETAAWARAHGITRLIVVTAGYHMPRALTELRRVLPGVVLLPVSVQPPALRHGMEFATVRMMANEYDKYLAVALHLSRHAKARRS